MDLEQFKSVLKIQIKNEYPNGFLQERITMGIEKHRKNFREYISLNPKSNLQEWKEKIERSVNTETTNPNELLVIGIFLLALDEFNP
ncbi:hypothetical protein [Elizabethkingia meningoseptica]|uniref:hypothetical protein n=1 Tax=Elizabethkingia meningoseptica TaxID=238 RepID=UPI0016273485|nr:hypothetical protein [Elizabethkingia meningoseptica]MBG0514564.1 hypothetical protein [Elizabethkingia meningoseptica]